MGNFYYNLCGGLNTQLTPVMMGADTKKMYWADGFNVEPYKNQGIARQKGNKTMLEISALIKPKTDETLPEQGTEYDNEAETLSVEALTEEGKPPLTGSDLSAFSPVALVAYPKGGENFLLGLSDGRVFAFDRAASSLRVVYDFGVETVNFAFEYFLDGIVILPKTQSGKPLDGIYYNPSMKNPVEFLNFKTADGEAISDGAVCGYAGRLWISSGDTLYYSALGTFNDWTTSHDAGYISKFHSSTSEILALKEYGGSLAIYKEHEVFLLTGTDPETFAITKFADKGAAGPGSVLTCNNKQYFFNDCGLFSLSLAGELSQIVMGQNRAQNNAKMFEKLDRTRLSSIIILALEIKNQIWIFPTIKGETGQKEVWIYDFALESWFTRIIPYEITVAASASGEILTVTPESGGKIFIENSGNTFSGKPVKFSFSTPFFHFSKPTDKKIVEEFEIICDGGFENNFEFSISTDYAAENVTKPENVRQISPNVLAGEGNSGVMGSAVWAGSGFQGGGIWADTIQEGIKLDIFEANKAVQLHFQGTKAGQDLAIIGFEFKGIIYEDA